MFAEVANLMLQELESQNLEVVLVPAPEPRHSGHCIRVSSNQNPHWFRVMNSVKRVRRDLLIPALQRLAEGKEPETAYELRAAGVIEKRLEGELVPHEPDCPF